MYRFQSAIFISSIEEFHVILCVCEAQEAVLLAAPLGLVKGSLT